MSQCTNQYVVFDRPLDHMVLKKIVWSSLSAVLQSWWCTTMLEMWTLTCKEIIITNFIMWCIPNFNVHCLNVHSIVVCLSGLLTLSYQIREICENDLNHRNRFPQNSSFKLNSAFYSHFWLSPEFCQFHSKLLFIYFCSSECWLDSEISFPTQTFLFTVLLWVLTFNRKFSFLWLQFYQLMTAELFILIVFCVSIPNPNTFFLLNLAVLKKMPCTPTENQSPCHQMTEDIVMLPVDLHLCSQSSGPPLSSSWPV